jgi:hypothetical protein
MTNAATAQHYNNQIWLACTHVAFADALTTHPATSKLQV